MLEIMGNYTTKSMLFFLVIFIMLKRVYSINCYQCSGTDSNEPFECNELLDSNTQIQQKDCEGIHDAKFCIKHVGRYEGIAIDCYQCNSSATMECGDGLMNLDGGILLAAPCDYVYNAKYCIKKTGGISTKRFCSALDLGNYCNYVDQPGDRFNYRTCVYTCSTDGCNGTTILIIPSVYSVLVISLVIIKYFGY